MKIEKKFLIGGANLKEKIFQEIFGQPWLFELSEKYDADDSNLGNLLIKVDIIPISMALSQAAIESGWGTSRYLREGNAVYGQYTFEKNKGIEPAQRDSSQKFFIRKFENLSESTKSYFKNINTHFSLRRFKRRKKKIKNEWRSLIWFKVSGFLTSYSERKQEYVKDVKKIIESNNFMKFDNSSFVN